MSDVNAQRAEEHIAQAEARLRMVETDDTGYVTAEIHAARCREAVAHAAIAQAILALPIVHVEEKRRCGACRDLSDTHVPGCDGTWGR